MFKIEILTGNNRDGKSWKFMKPTKGSEYTFATEKEARDIMEMCYPDASKGFDGYESVRVVECQ